MTTKRLAAMVASGVLLLGGGVGMAAALTPSPSPTADVGSTKASDDTSPEVENQAPETEVEHAPENEPVETPEVEGPDDSGNHGATVSAVAHDTPPGPNHGKTVSAVAGSNSDRSGDDDAAGHDANHDANDDDAPGTEDHHGANRGSGGSGSGGSDDGGHHGGGSDD